MVRCDKCKKLRPRRDILTCPCCDGRFCIIGEQGDTCADRHEESGD